MPNDPVPLVGVTGGIGSGKSVVSRYFGELGRTVISADRIAHDLTEEDEEVRREVAARFGPAIYDAEGKLRRTELARIVFADRACRLALNAIVHPRVFKALDEALASLPHLRRSPFVLVEAALVFESGMDKKLHATIVVRASEENRIARVIARDGLPRDEIVARMRAQMSPAEAAQRGDFVIDNDGPEELLRTKVAFVDGVLKQMFVGAPPFRGKRR